MSDYLTERNQRQYQRMREALEGIVGNYSIASIDSLFSTLEALLHALEGADRRWIEHFEGPLGDLEMAYAVALERGHKGFSEDDRQFLNTAMQELKADGGRSSQQDRQRRSGHGAGVTCERWERGARRRGAGFWDGRVIHLDPDHLGSVRLETDGTGQDKYREFWPYGDEATAPGGGEWMKFTGHERDLGNLASTADDIDSMHERYYRGIFGRFPERGP